MNDRPDSGPATGREGAGAKESRAHSHTGQWAPVVAVAALALLTFGVYRLGRPDPPTRIHVTELAVQDVIRLQEDLRGVPLAEHEIPEVIAAYVDDEVLLREAFRQGVDRGDPRVRQALRDAMWQELAGAFDPGDPTEAQLRTHFEQDPERYRRSATVSVELLSFGAGTLSAEDRESVLAQLRAGVSADSLVGPNAARATPQGLTSSQFSQTYGRDVGVPAFNGALGRWQGPLESDQSTDFIRVLERAEAPPVRFEDVVRLVEHDWIQAQYSQQVETALRSIRRRYRVELPEQVLP